MKLQSRKRRKIFYVDVGPMPPHKVKEYLEKIKKEMAAGKQPKEL